MSAVLYAQSAQIDLLEAWLYIAQENPAAADRVLDAIDSEACILATRPLMGRQRPELGRGVRSWPTSTPYILFYLIKGDDINVLRVLHRARDLRHVVTAS